MDGHIWLRSDCDHFCVDNFKPPASKHLTVGLIFCTEKGATLLQSELNSDVERFTNHIKPVLQQISLLTGLNVGGKTLNIAFNWLCSNSVFLGNVGATFSDNMALFVLKPRNCMQ